MLIGVPIQGILFTVFQSIFQVFLLCLAGFILSFKGIVDKPTSKVLNHINIALFTPALLFSKVAYFLTPAKLRQLWVIPVFFTILTGLSAIIAYCLGRACRLKRSQVNFATAASMFMNSNSLPVALMQSLAATVPLLKWGQDDTVDAIFGRSLTYLVVFSTLGMMLRWSYGVRLISQVDEPESPISAPTTYRDTVDSHATAQLVYYETETETEPLDQSKWRTRPLHSRLHPHPRRHTYPRIHSHSRLPAVPTSLGDQSESEDSSELETTEGDSDETIVLRSEPVDVEFSADPRDSTSSPLPSSSSPEPNAPRWAQHTRPSPLPKRILAAFTSLSPPLVASLVALFCVLVPPVQRLLQSEEMIPFKGALDSAGACSVPLTLIVLGGWFWDEETKPHDKGAHAKVDDVKGSDGQGNAKSKGKGIDTRHSHGRSNGALPIPDERQGHADGSTTKNARPRSGPCMTSYSRDSSTASLSSMIGAFGDVLMARIRSRGVSLQAKRHVRGNIGASERDVEPGLLVTHAETVDDTSNGRLESPSRPRSRTDSVNGRTRLSPIPSSSPTSVLSSPDSPHAQGANPPGETLTIFVTLLARMGIVPLVVTPMMVLISRLGWGGEVFEDPVFIVSSMLLIASPPALTLAQISQRAKATTGTGTNTEAVSSFERLLSRTVFWSYCILTPPLTIASIMVGLLLIGA